MAQYTLEHGQRNLIPTLKTVQWGLGIGGWCADLLNGMWWARAAQPGFLLMCNIYRSYIGILLQEMWHAPIKETIAIVLNIILFSPSVLSIAWLGSSVLHPFGTLKPFDPRWKPLSTLGAHNTAEVAGQCYMKEQTFHYHVTWTKMTFANIWSEMILANVHRLPFHAPLFSEHTLSTLRAQENNQGLLRAPEREGVLKRAQERAPERAL